MTEVIREYNGWELNEGHGMANGLWNVSNMERGELSNWFTSETKDELLAMDDREFERKCMGICINDEINE
jgi:hypothetical protein